MSRESARDKLGEVGRWHFFGRVPSQFTRRQSDPACLEFSLTSAVPLNRRRQNSSEKEETEEGRGRRGLGNLGSSDSHSGENKAAFSVVSSSSSSSSPSSIQRTRPLGTSVVHLSTPNSLRTSEREGLVSRLSSDEGSANLSPVFVRSVVHPKK